MAQDENGNYIHIEQFYTEDTYKGLILGAPNERINNSIIELIKIKAVRIMESDRAFHLIKPEIFKKSNTPFLPSRICIACLISNESINDSMGSELILSWFSDDPIEKGVNEIVQSALNKIEWRKFAKGFDL